MQFLLGFDPNVAPLGIITLEDVLEGVYVLMTLLASAVTCCRVDRRRDL